jgi:AraC family transcriptional regulator
MNQATKREGAAAVLAPRFESAGAMLLGGLSDRFTSSTTNGIPGLWQQFGPHIGKIAAQIERVAYGVCYNVEMSPFAMSYLTAVQVSNSENLPPGFTILKLLPHRYAIFSHSGHVSAIQGTVDAIFHSWLPTSGHTVESSPQDGLAFFERYGENFDPRTGTGDIEIWVPIKE